MLLGALSHVFDSPDLNPSSATSYVIIGSLTVLSLSESGDK